VVQRGGRESTEALFDFTTTVGRGSGVVRVVAGDDGAPKAWVVLTTLQELAGFEEPSGDRRPRGEAYSRNFGGRNWLDQRTAALEYEDADPAVLVVGGGQAGLGIAARLRHLGVDALVVDRMDRVGDNWRKRYRSLALHNEVWVNHLPYMPFPDSWPVYVPKDKLANWFESYVRRDGNQLLDVDGVRRRGVRRRRPLVDRDGATVPADLVVLATGYRSQQELVRARFGDAVADHVGQVWGFDEHGELANMWKRTAQEGLWFHAGSLAQNRIYSKYLALQIKACEEGLIEPAATPVPRALVAGGSRAEA
jgi:hypothetical protein